MNRDHMRDRLRDYKGTWDFIIIGGGATGIGTAIDSASRGYNTLLLEQDDFGKGTSSRSTKLIHGGIRYLQQGNISLVLEALKERGLLLNNAPHLVHDLPFIVPNYEWWEGPFYGIGLKIYDLLAGKHGFGKSKRLNKEKIKELLPTIETQGLRGGEIYYDGQFDDSRLIINMAETAASQGAILLNYLKVTGLTYNQDMIAGVIAQDIESGEDYQLHGKAVINATGPFCDSIRQMDMPGTPPVINPSRGIHMVLDKSFLPGGTAIMVPHTDDGRVLFAIPWNNRILVGTTDTPVTEITLEPVPGKDEIDFLLSHAARYLTKSPTKTDVLSVFAGLRPLVGSVNNDNTAALSRDHSLYISRSGLLTIAGGKWTTYRKMAEDTINQAVMVADLESKPSVSSHLRIHGYHTNIEQYGDLAHYGSDAPKVKAVIEENQDFSKPLHENFKTRAGEVVWAVRHEMARRVEDFLARRTRLLLKDAKASNDIAPKVAALMAKELGHDDQWQYEEIRSYHSLTKKYLPASETSDK